MSCIIIHVGDGSGMRTDWLKRHTAGFDDEGKGMN